MALEPDREGRAAHTRAAVYGEMVMMIAMKYPGLPDPRTMTFEEIEFWYEGIRGLLEAETKPQSRKGR